MKESGLAKLQKQEKYLGERLQRMRVEVQSYEDQLRDADPNVLLGFKSRTEGTKDETKPPAIENNACSCLY